MEATWVCLSWPTRSLASPSLVRQLTFPNALPKFYICYHFATFQRFQSLTSRTPFPATYRLEALPYSHPVINLAPDTEPGPRRRAVGVRIDIREHACEF